VKFSFPEEELIGDLLQGPRSDWKDHASVPFRGWHHPSIALGIKPTGDVKAQSRRIPSVHEAHVRHRCLLPGLQRSCGRSGAGKQRLRTAHAEDLVPGKSVFGQRNFIEYVPGELPLVIAAPHGGQLKSEEIPNRTNGVTDIDANTQELARTIAAVVHAETGRHIHLVVCRLHRSKLDANRDLAEATQGNELAVQAWKEHHAFIETACEAAVR
jgi:hypothetical protein